MFVKCKLTGLVCLNVCQVSVMFAINHVLLYLRLQVLPVGDNVISTADS